MISSLVPEPSIARSGWAAALAPASGATAGEGAVWNVEWVYFSFITLTTLGYGDITPVSNTARALAYSEAIFGVFYMAILVAGLVSVYMAARRSDDG